MVGVLLLGIGIATVTDVEYSTTGMTYALAAISATAGKILRRYPTCRPVSYESNNMLDPISNVI